MSEIKVEASNKFRKIVVRKSIKDFFKKIIKKDKRWFKKKKYL